MKSLQHIDVPRYLISDEPGCFIDDAIVIHSNITGKSAKMDIFNLLPVNISNVLYMDADIRAQPEFSIEELRGPECEILLEYESWVNRIGLR